MKRRMRWVLLLVIALTCAGSVLPGPACALSLGISLGYGSGRIDDGDSSRDFTATRVHLVLDTAVARDRLLNYRLGCGYERRDLEDASGTENVFALTNTLGFGLLRTTSARLWLGPQIISAIGYRDDENIESFEFGIAPVLGANFHLSPLLSLGLELGYGFTRYLADPGSGWKQGLSLSTLVLFRFHDAF